MGLVKRLGTFLVLAGIAQAMPAEVVVVVSARSPLTELSSTELHDIYLGRQHRLSSGDPLTPIDQREGTPAREEFYARFLGRSNAQMKAHWSKLIFTGRGHPPRTAANDRAAAELIASAPDAIGYVDRSLVDERLRVVAIE